MTGLKVNGADTAFADALNKSFSTDAKKYTFAQLGNPALGLDGQFCVYHAEKRPLDDKNVEVRAMALNYLKNISDAVEHANVSISLAKLENGVLTKIDAFTPDKENLAKYILASAAAQKIHDAFLNSVGIFARFWNFITQWARKEETTITKVNKLFDNIITKCNTEYQKIATPEPKKA